MCSKCRVLNLIAVDTIGQLQVLYHLREMLSNKAFVLSALALACVTAGAGESTALRFSVPQGGVLNEFYRDGPVAAHLVLTSGSAPRVVIAFPAGNSGTAIWLTAKSTPLAWQPDVTIESAELDVPGGALHGITANVVGNRRARIGSPGDHGQCARDPGI